MSGEVHRRGGGKGLGALARYLAMVVAPLRNGALSLIESIRHRGDGLDPALGSRKEDGRLDCEGVLDAADLAASTSSRCWALANSRLKAYSAAVRCSRSRPLPPGP